MKVGYIYCPNCGIVDMKIVMFLWHFLLHMLMEIFIFVLNVNQKHHILKHWRNIRYE